MAGLMGIDIPEEYGGSGMGFTASIIAIEELAKASVPCCSAPDPAVLPR